ncbi:tyrosine-type recombinase/integrase [Actinoallomurus sp. NPDC052308]|uniref:tyrosine-type recombinase/integrase n=1 Tax=Actinoallomurus sp. NPDC052308 TaxID=3155530 RepID=UPI00342F2ED4
MTAVQESPAPRRRGTPGSKGTTRDVRRPWKIGKAKSKTKPHMVRWVVAGEVFTSTFATFALADGFRSELIQAMGRGEEFDVATGLPQSMLKIKKANSFFAFCKAYVAVRWEGAAAKTRESITDSLAMAMLVMVEGGPERPTDTALRHAFLWAVHPANAQADPPRKLEPAVRWLSRRSLALSSITDPAIVRRVFHRLTLTMEGRRAAGDTFRRRRRGLNTALEYAVELEEIPDNPLKRLKAKRTATADRVDPRVVITHAQARELLTAVSYVGSWNRARGRRLEAFFAVLYYAGLRPAEAVALCESDCELPEKGWGRLILAKTLPVTTKKWTDSGNRHDPRGLKQRDANAVRNVPIPPWLVEILRAHIKEFGVADDGRLFQNERGGIVGSTTFSRVWEEARKLAFTPAQVDSPLAGRPYDLRHAALTTWLNAGVNPAEVANRAGNSVEVLLKRYAGCLDNQEMAVNRRIQRALREGAPVP